MIAHRRRIAVACCMRAVALVYIWVIVACCRPGYGKSAVSPRVTANSRGFPSAMLAPAVDSPRLEVGVVVPEAREAQPVPPAAGHIQAGLSQALGLLQDSGWSGYAVLLVAFSLWVFFALPTTPVEVAAGFMYGVFWGSACGFLCKTIGSCAAFAVVRLFRRRMGWQVPDTLKPKLQALHDAPLVTMVGVRLAPLPLGVKNYGLALVPGIDIARYALAASAVNAPFSLLWASAGVSCRSLEEALTLDATTGSSLHNFRAAAGPAVIAALLMLYVAVWPRRAEVVHGPRRPVGSETV